METQALLTGKQDKMSVKSSEDEVGCMERKQKRVNSVDQLVSNDRPKRKGDSLVSLRYKLHRSNLGSNSKLIHRGVPGRRYVGHPINIQIIRDQPGRPEGWNYLSIRDAFVTFHNL